MSRNGSPRILISRMSAIGDTVLTLPVLCALRRAMPRAFIAWVVERGAAPMLEGHDALDELIVLPRLWSTSPRFLWQLRRRLRELRFNVALDPQSVTKSALANWLSGAPQRIGLGGSYGKELSPWLNNQLVQYRHAHIVDRSLELLEPLGITHCAAEFRIPRNVAAENKIAAALTELELDGPLAIVNPGASWDSKLWPTNRYAEVCRHLAWRYGLPTVVVWAGERELGWAREIVAQAGGAAVLAPQTNLVELTALLRGKKLFVGSDTGPMHIAAAVGTPCVALYGTTRPEDCGPYGSHHVAIQIRYHAGSRKQRRRANNDAMKLITVQQVCDACDEILMRAGKTVSAA